jgi:hypothetical protein
LRITFARRDPAGGRAVIRNTAPGDGFSEIAARIFYWCRSLLGRSLVNKLTLVVAVAALTTLSACKKTGEGQYEVQKPVIGTETDTVNTPTVETGTVKDTIEVTRPTVEVNKPKE